MCILTVASASTVLAGSAHARRSPWPADALPQRELRPDSDCATPGRAHPTCSFLSDATLRAIRESLTYDLFAGGRGLIDPFERTLYVRDALGHTIALDAQSGARRWRSKAPAHPLLATEDGLVVMRQGALELVDKTRGRTGVYARCSVYGSENRDNLGYAAAETTSVQAFDPARATRRWRVALGVRRWHVHIVP